MMPAPGWLTVFLKQFEWRSLVNPDEQPDSGCRCLLVEPWRWCCLSSQDEELSRLHWQAIVEHSFHVLLIPDDIELSQSQVLFCRSHDISVFTVNHAFESLLSNADSLSSLRGFHPVAQHGVCLSLDGVGVLLLGAAGVGKSEAALAMLYQGAKLVADDAPLLSQTGLGGLRVTCPELLQGFLAVRDLGVLRVFDLLEGGVTEQADLQLVVRILRSGESATVVCDPLRGAWGVASVCDVPLLLLELRQAGPADIALKVQIAVAQIKLLAGGVDSVTEFRSRSDEAMDSPD